MADLMSGNHDMKALANKYGNFVTPAYKIKVDGSDVVKSLKLGIDRLTVKQSLNYAGSCDFSIINAYDLESHAFKSKIKSKFKLGTVIEVELGYDSSTTMVFKGYISSVGVDFSEVPALTVSAMDLRRLMMDGKERFYTYKLKKYSDIFEDVMKPYKSLYSSLVVDATSEELVEFKQKSSDYNFVQYDLARMADREFFMLGDKVYFRVKDSNTTPFIKLNWQKDLLSFSRDSLYKNVQVKVIGFDPEKRETVEGEATEKTDNQKSAVSEAQMTVISDANIISQADAKKRAKAEAKALKRMGQTGQGVCVGLPEIVPGRYLEVADMDDEVNGKYYITDVTHTIGAGFTTTFTIGIGSGGAGGGVKFAEEVLDASSDDKGSSPSQKEKGNKLIHGIMPAEVTANWDDKHPGQVQVKFFLGEEGYNQTEWIRVAQPHAGNEYGSYFLPEVGDEVLIAFNMGDINQPYVIGSLWNNGKNKLPPETAVQDNNIKRLKTKGGHEVIFDDKSGEERIEIHTKGKLTIMLEDKEKHIAIKDDSGNNILEIDGKGGAITVKADKKITLDAKGKAVLELDGSGNKATLKAGTINVEAQQQVNIKGQTLKVEGTQVEMKGSGSFKAESSGMMTIKGSMTKIN
ncbi:MAG: phage baseplate assembly protein V [Syntrophomonadaceae bacterium]|nr:phage baseplate assembly protein V [Syntrophomonadaceae bacterium]